MVILIFSISFVFVFFITRSYRYFDKYYSTVLFVSTISLLYILLARSYMLWVFTQWWIITGKVSVLIQFSVLFPSTIVLYLRLLTGIKNKWLKMLCFLMFFGIYILMEVFLKLQGEIVYLHGWSFAWSVFINFFLFSFAWLHEKSWKIAWPLSACVVVFLIVWFRVPLGG